MCHLGNCNVENVDKDHKSSFTLCMCSTLCYGLTLLSPQVDTLLLFHDFLWFHESRIGQIINWDFVKSFCENVDKDKDAKPWSWYSFAVHNYWATQQMIFFMNSKFNAVEPMNNL